MNHSLSTVSLSESHDGYDPIKGCKFFMCHNTPSMCTDEGLRSCATQPILNLVVHLPCGVFIPKQCPFLCMPLECFAVQVNASYSDVVPMQHTGRCCERWKTGTEHCFLAAMVFILLWVHLMIPFPASAWAHVESVTKCNTDVRQWRALKRRPMQS